MPFTSFSEGSEPRRSDTRWTLLQKILMATRAGGGGGGGAGSVLAYTTDPTTDGIVPTNQNQPAIAYKNDGIGGPIYNWDTVNHVWF